MDTSDFASLMRAASANARGVAVRDARNQELGLLAIFTPAYVRDRSAQELRGERPGGWTLGGRR